MSFVIHYTIGALPQTLRMEEGSGGKPFVLYPLLNIFIHISALLNIRLCSVEQKNEGKTMCIL